MKNNIKDNLSEEHLAKIKHRTGYKINETPRYRALVNDAEEFDAVPNPNATLDGQPMPSGQNLRMSEAGDQEDAPKPEGEVPVEPTMDDPKTGDSLPPTPEFAGDEESMEDPTDPTMSTNRWCSTFPAMAITIRFG